MKIANKENNPYQDLKFLEKERVHYQGRDHVIYRYQKEYSSTERLKKLAKYIFPTLLTCCLILFHPKYRQRWRKILSGKGIKEIMFPKRILNIDIQPPLAQAEAAIDPAKTARLQEQLNAHHIGLNCLHPAPLVNKNCLQKDQIQAFLEEVKNHHPEAYPLEEKLFQSLKMLSFDELQTALKQCCIQLNEMLKGQNYTIGFVKNKSTQWLAELALPYLDDAPASSFEHATDNIVDVHGEQSKIEPQDRCFVIFDDAAYSGKQLCYIIEKLKSAIAEAHQNEPCHLYLVVPFISSIAKKRFEEKINRVSPGLVDESSKNLPKGNLKIHLITTDKKIKSITEIFTVKEIESLAKFAEQDEQPGPGYFDGGAISKCLTFTEWKTPDDASVPSTVKSYYHEGQKKYQFVTNFTPPYKQRA
jgi:hypothetical protein